ncbi:MAG: hypothetical protein ACFE0I_22305 [Elainellaceae cyanobacterium]
MFLENFHDAPEYEEYVSDRLGHGLKFHQNTNRYEFAMPLGSDPN